MFNYSCHKYKIQENFRDLSIPFITKKVLKVAVKYNSMKARIPDGADIEVHGPGWHMRDQGEPALEVILNTIG